MKWWIAVALAGAWPVLLAGCPTSEPFEVDDDDVADDDTADDDTGDDDTGDDDTGDDDTGDDDDTPDCSGGSGAATGGQFLTVAGDSTWLYVPATVMPCAPLVLFGHGGQSPGGYANGNWMDMLQTNLPAEADARGFALMVPYLEDAQSVQHTWYTTDVDAMDQMIDETAALLDVDRSAVMFVGQSAGGHMAAYYGLYNPGKLDRSAVVSAGLGAYFDYPDSEPDPKLPFFVAHDPNDDIVPYSYSENLASELADHGHEYVFEDYSLGGNGHGWSQELTTDILDWWLD